MNRLEKKCLFGSASLHALLVVVFLFGAAFLPKREKNDRPQVLEIVPFNALKFTDGPSSGGNPNVAPPPALKPQPVVQPPAPPQPKPEPEKRVETVKPKEPVQPKERESKPTGDDPAPVKPKAVQRDLSSLTNKIVKRTSPEVAQARAQQEARDRAERERADAARKMQAIDGALKLAAQGLGKGLSGRVTSSVETYGPGGGGPAVANWRAAVGDIYTRAWDPPQDAKGSAKTGVKLTIARDGTVLSGRITRPSGDAPLDRSVERVLQEVKTVPAFPEGATEDQRTLNIIFDLTVKRSL